MHIGSNHFCYFREKLLGTPPGIRDEEFDEWLMDDDEDSLEEDSDPECPLISIQRSEKARLRQPWTTTLIVKLLGRPIGQATLLNKIQTLWKPKASFDPIVMDIGLYLVKFSSIDDYDFTRYGGPCLIFNHHFMVQPWRPYFDTTQLNILSLLVWICILCLPIEFYDYSFLFLM